MARVLSNLTIEFKGTEIMLQSTNQNETERKKCYLTWQKELKPRRGGGAIKYVFLSLSSWRNRGFGPLGSSAFLLPPKPNSGIKLQWQKSKCSFRCLSRGIPKESWEVFIIHRFVFQIAITFPAVYYIQTKNQSTSEKKNLEIFFIARFSVELAF